MPSCRWARRICARNSSIARAGPKASTPPRCISAFPICARCHGCARWPEAEQAGCGWQDEVKVRTRPWRPRHWEMRNGLREPWQYRYESVAPVPGLHDLRRSPIAGPTRGRWMPKKAFRSSAAALEAGINFFDTANSYSDGTSEEIVGAALRAVRPARRGGDRHQGLQPDEADAQRRRPVAQGHLPRDRPEPAAPGHRLRRPVPDSPLGPVDAHRGDAGGPARRGQGRQGPLHRRLDDVRMAVRQGAAYLGQQAA